jgi:hypothetical protein
MMNVMTRKHWERPRHVGVLPEPVGPDARWLRSDYAFMAGMVASNHAGGNNDARDFLHALSKRLEAGEEFDEGSKLFEALRQLHNATWGFQVRDNDGMPCNRESADMNFGIVEVLLIAATPRRDGS